MNINKTFENTLGFGSDLNVQGNVVLLGPLYTIIYLP